MAIIKSTFVNGRLPSGKTAHGYFHHNDDDTWIGVGNAGGTDSANKTELSIAELKTYSKTLGWKYVEMTDRGNPATITLSRLNTDAEMDTIVDEWCTARGIS